MLCGSTLSKSHKVIFVTPHLARLCDLSQAYALLGIVASLAPVIFGYYSKSKAENTEGGIVYETAMKEHETTNSESGKG